MNDMALVGIGVLGLLLMIIFPILYFGVIQEKFDAYQFLPWTFLNIFGFLLLVLAMVLYFYQNYSSNEILLRNITIAASIGGIAYGLITTLFSWNRIVWAAG